MRKTVSILLLVALLALTLSACGVGEVKIEDYEWKMRMVMSNDIELADSDAIVLAVGEADEAYPNAKIKDLTLMANDGEITVTDAINNKTYEGTYKVSKKTPDGTDYEITIDGKSGYATVAMTKYYDGTEEPTLPINLGDYSLYFFGETSNE